MKICILANFSYSNTLYIKYFSYICTIKQNQGRKSNAKAYIIDPGLQNNRDNSFAGENIGWRLENVVYIELLRRCANEYLDIYYYKDTPRSKEVDFVICNQNKAVELIQVSYDKSRLKSDTVGLLSKIKITNLANKCSMSYVIVNPHEADLHSGKISIKSPIAKALLGKKAGDEVMVKVPAGLLKFRLDSVEL